MVRAACGNELASTMVLSDHDPFSPATLAKLLAMGASCEVLVVTEKDWSKLQRVPADAWPCAVARPELHLRFVAGERALAAAMIAAVRASPNDNE
jgi:tetraacyldisaccharide-1-P 4'-kinase